MAYLGNDMQLPDAARAWPHRQGCARGSCGRTRSGSAPSGLRPVPVRVIFPDGVVLQASFGALEPLSKLRVRCLTHYDPSHDASLQASARFFYGQGRACVWRHTIDASMWMAFAVCAPQELVTACLLPSLAGFHLFTTPPKQVLKDLDASFYKAGLVPRGGGLLWRRAGRWPVLEDGGARPQGGQPFPSGAWNALRPESEACLDILILHS